MFESLIVGSFFMLLLLSVVCLTLLLRSFARVSITLTIVLSLLSSVVCLLSIFAICFGCNNGPSVTAHTRMLAFLFTFPSIQSVILYLTMAFLPLSWFATLISLSRQNALREHWQILLLSLVLLAFAGFLLVIFFPPADQGISQWVSGVVVASLIILTEQIILARMVFLDSAS